MAGVRSPNMKLLIVEDNAPDAELTVRQLKSEGIDCAWTRVATEEAFRDALRGAPDLIICDCMLPGFDGMAAFSIAASEAPDVPFVFVSGTLGDERTHQALQGGATACIAKGDRRLLAQAVRSALQPGPGRRRRVTDRSKPPAATDAGTGAAQHLLARRAVLDDTLPAHDPAAMPSLVRDAPPSPAALVAIEAGPVRERFEKLLTMANLQIESSVRASEALGRLAASLHALLFTDNLALIRCARQLPSGAATHIVFVSSAGDSLESEALRAGANDWVPSDARGEHFWAHLTIARRIADLAASLQRALHDNCMLSTLDELTGAGRRHYFQEQFPREVERAGRLGRPLGIVMCDIDHFKRVNDRHGHQLGDQVLREFVARINGSLRVGRDWIARLGGEEFAVVLPDTTASEAAAVAERLRERVRSELFARPARPTSISASFGVCALDQLAGDCNELAYRMVKAADAALYESKRRGRNRVTAGHIGDERPRASNG